MTGRIALSGNLLLSKGARHVFRALMRRVIVIVRRAMARSGIWRRKIVHEVRDGRGSTVGRYPCEKGGRVPRWMYLGVL